MQKEFEQVVSMKCQKIPTEMDTAQEYIRDGPLEAADEICGWTRGGCPQHKETWWWNSEVKNAVKEKRKAWKQWKNGGAKEKYLKAKKLLKQTIFCEKRCPDKAVCKR